MQVKKTLISVVALALAAAFPCVASAQSSSINAFSPYSMYGIGEVNTPGTLQSRSMGGVGVAMRSYNNLNLLNPASFSIAPQQSFLFDFGIEGQNFYNSQKVSGATKRSGHNTFNFHEIGFQLPLGKRIGLGFGLTPYSSVGYRVKAQQIDGSYGWADYLYQGEGDVSEVKLGIGWEVFKRFSIGAAAQYYWGDIKRTYNMTPTNIVDNTVISSTSGVDMYSVSRFKAQLGVQWTAIHTDKHRLQFGATYDFGGNLNPSVKKSVRIGNQASSIVSGDTTRLALALPMQIAAGVVYGYNSKLTIGFDYVRQNWRSDNIQNSESTIAGYNVEYTNTNTFKFGVEYIPNITDIRRYFNRISYRAGLRFGGYNQTFGGKHISQYAVTFGVGLPVRFLSGSAVDVGFEYGGRRGSGEIENNTGFVQQQYFKVSVGFTIFGSPRTSNEYWFVRPKFD